MAVFTSLSRPELATLARAFGIAPLHRARGIAAGTVNTIYALRGGQPSTKAVLRVLENRPRRDADFEQSLLEHLAARGLPVPAPRATRQGELVVSLGPRHHVSIFSYVEGKELTDRDARPEHAAQIGRFLAQMHRAGRGFRRQRRNAYGPDPMRRMLGQCLDYASTRREQAWLRTLAAELKRYEAPNVPHGVVHADLFPDNAKFVRGRLEGVIDFEMACTAPLVLDVATALCAWCFVGTRFQTDRARALVHAYDAERPMTPRERRLLGSFCRYAAARFTITRYYDFVVHAQRSGDRLVKDYREFLGRLGYFRRRGGSPLT